MLDKVVYDSLVKIRQNYLHLNQQLNDPEIVSDVKKYRQISQEIAQITDVVQVFNQYLAVFENYQQAKELLNITKDESIAALSKQEINEALKKLTELSQELKILLLPRDENDARDVIVEIRGAAGGQEANIFAGDLFEIYKKWAALHGLQVKPIVIQKSESGGFTLVVFSVKGPMFTPNSNTKQVCTAFSAFRWPRPRDECTLPRRQLRSCLKLMIRSKLKLAPKI